MKKVLCGICVMVMLAAAFGVPAEEEQAVPEAVPMATPLSTAENVIVPEPGATVAADAVEGPQTPAFVPVQVQVRLTDVCAFLDVHTAPAAGAPVAARLANGMIVTATGTASGGWRPIRCAGGGGYVRDDCLSADIRAVEAGASEAAEDMPEAEETPEAEEDMLAAEGTPGAAEKMPGTADVLEAAEFPGAAEDASEAEETPGAADSPETEGTSGAEDMLAAEGTSGAVDIPEAEKIPGAAEETPEAAPGALPSGGEIPAKETAAAEIPLVTEDVPTESIPAEDVPTAEETSVAAEGFAPAEVPAETLPSAASMQAVRIFCADEHVAIGSTVIMGSELIGYDGAAVVYQWQQQQADGSWVAIAGANTETYSFVMTEALSGCAWRLTVNEAD